MDGEKFLIIKRNEHEKHFPGLWDFPGGKPNPEETPEETLKRETKDETGLDIRVGKPLGEYVGESFGLHVTFTVFAVEVVSGSVQLSKDHTEYRWATKEEILQLPTMPFLEPFFV